jgi:hypothetical protein
MFTTGSRRRDRREAEDADDQATEQWVGELAEQPPPGPPPWRQRQAANALALLLARLDHPGAVARAAVVLNAPPGATTAEAQYGLRAHPAPSALCPDCGAHHGPAACCLDCGAVWNITPEEPLYDHRPDRPGPEGPDGPLAGLCYVCGLRDASLPAAVQPAPALPAGAPPCEADDPPEPEPGPAALAGANGDGGAGPLAIEAAAPPARNGGRPRRASKAAGG